jgi:hypothetical protein
MTNANRVFNLGDFVYISNKEQQKILENIIGKKHNTQINGVAIITDNEISSMENPKRKFIRGLLLDENGDIIYTEIVLMLSDIIKINSFECIKKTTGKEYRITKRPANKGEIVKLYCLHDCMRYDEDACNIAKITRISDVYEIPIYYTEKGCKLSDEDYAVIEEIKEEKEEKLSIGQKITTIIKNAFNKSTI